MPIERLKICAWISTHPCKEHQVLPCGLGKTSKEVYPFTRSRIKDLSTRRAISIDNMPKYTEKEMGITRKYKLLPDSRVEKYITEKAVVDIVSTEAFNKMVFIDGELQMSSKDEYIYHEMLVHPALSAVKSHNKKRVCIIGGGDGCAAREVLRWNDIKFVDLIDWDSDLINMFTNTYYGWNNSCYKDKRVRTIVADIQNLTEKDYEYDCIIIDLLDPDSSNQKNNQLWLDILTTAKKWLAPGGSIVMNAGGIVPWNTETPKWLVRMIVHNYHDLKNYGLMAYKTFVPSFTNEWCFLMIAPLDTIDINPDVNPHIKNCSYFDSKSWLCAKTWSRDYNNSVPHRSVNLNTYLPN